MARREHQLSFILNEEEVDHIPDNSTGQSHAQSLVPPAPQSGSHSYVLGIDASPEENATGPAERSDRLHLSFILNKEVLDSIPDKSTGHSPAHSPAQRFPQPGCHSSWYGKGPSPEGYATCSTERSAGLDASSSLCIGGGTTIFSERPPLLLLPFQQYDRVTASHSAGHWREPMTPSASERHAGGRTQQESLPSSVHPPIPLTYSLPSLSHGPSAAQAGASRENMIDGNLKCDACSNIYKYESSLKRHHRNIHLGIKPWACRFCGFRFAQEKYVTNYFLIRATQLRLVS